MQRVGPTGETAPLELSYSDAGARIGVSRTHVRKLLNEAQDRGLVRLTRGASQLVEPKPALVKAFDRFLANSMAGHDLIYNLALARRVEMDTKNWPRMSGHAKPSCKVDCRAT
jgi:DNA-binding FadR family transcriptional regulator